MGVTAAHVRAPTALRPAYVGPAARARRRAPLSGTSLWDSEGTALSRDARPAFGTVVSGGAVVYRKCACGGDAGPGGECDACRKKREAGVQRFPRPAPAAPISAEAPPVVYDALRAGGRPLDPAERGFFESRMGHDFGGVRVHTGTLAAQSADAVSALAYTVGRDIVFAAGRYAPGTSAGRKLLAHELAHVRQDGQRGVEPSRGLTLADPGGTAEWDANRVADRVAEGPLRAGDRSPTGRAVVRRTPAAPTYGGVTAVRDPSRLTIDAVPDFAGGNLAMMRVVNPHVNDINVKHLSWELYDPSDHLMDASFSTISGTPAATIMPIILSGDMFMGAGFVPGKYLLRCVGRNASHQPIVYADRDFTVVSADLATGVPVPTTYGVLDFVQYNKTDGTPHDPSYTINVTLMFLPASSVVCNDVTFIQSVLSIDNQGRSLQYTANPETDARKTPLAWSIDQLAGVPSPYYIVGKDPDTGSVGDVAGYGHAGHGGAPTGEATMSDTPAWNQVNNAKFESCVICRSGANRGQVYGCATWGYTATADGKVTLMPRSFRQMPSDQFEEARTAWNAWRTTLPTQPEEAPQLRSP